MTGSNQFIGNWPGVTVEKKSGHLIGHPEVEILDLPGLYSLAANSLEEIIASKELTENPPDAIINIVDGTNLERNLYMTTQLFDLGIPLILVINMADELRQEGISIDADKLSERIGYPVVAISALKGENIDKLSEQLLSPEIIQNHPPKTDYGADVEAVISQASEIIKPSFPESQLRYWSFRSLEPGFKQNLDQAQQLELQRLQEDYESSHDGDDLESMIAGLRYDKIDQLVSGTIHGSRKGELSFSDRVDQIVTNRWLALPIFVLVMVIVYGISITTLGTYLTDWTNEVLFGEIVPGFVSSLLEKMSVAEWLQSLILDGIVAGVGAVLGFVPQMLVLFFMLAFLEASGYMARIAFIMDRAFRKWGLSGKSFIPLLVGSGCSVPGIMASRTIEEESDRRMTVILTSFIPLRRQTAGHRPLCWRNCRRRPLGCTRGLLPGNRGSDPFRSAPQEDPRFKGEPSPFVMELPPYRLPGLKTVLRSTWERGWSFIKKKPVRSSCSPASSFGRCFASALKMAALRPWKCLKQLYGSPWQPDLLDVPPAGWDSWQAAVATITGLVAKENVVNTFGILFGYAEVSETGTEIWANVAQHFGVLGGFSFLIFNLLCIPCFAAIGAIKREMNNAGWTWFALIYQSVFAYAVSFVFYQIGNWALTQQFGFMTILAILLVLGTIYFLVRPEKQKEVRTPQRNGVRA